MTSTGESGLVHSFLFLLPEAVPRDDPAAEESEDVTKTAVGMVELLPSVLLNLASGPQIAVTKTAIHIAVIASDAHISGTSRSDRRSRSWRTSEGSCVIVDISYTSLPKPTLA